MHQAKCQAEVFRYHSDMGHCFSSVVKVSKELFYFFFYKSFSGKISAILPNGNNNDNKKKIHVHTEVSCK